MSNAYAQIFFATPEERAAEAAARAAETPTESYLRRLHFWIRFWSVLSIAVVALCLLVVGTTAVVSKANENQNDRYQRRLEIR